MATLDISEDLYADMATASANQDINVTQLAAPSPSPEPQTMDNSTKVTEPNPTSCAVDGWTATNVRSATPIAGAVKASTAEDDTPATPVKAAPKKRGPKPKMAEGQGNTKELKEKKQPKPATPKQKLNLASSPEAAASESTPSQKPLISVTYTEEELLAKVTDDEGDDEDDAEVEPAPTIAPKKASKTGNPQAKKSANKTAPKAKAEALKTENDDRDEEETHEDDGSTIKNAACVPLPATPVTPKGKKTAGKAKTAANGGTTTPSTPTPGASGKKRGSIVTTETETPSKKAKTDGSDVKFDPAKMAKLKPADRMLFEMKALGKSWPAISETLQIMGGGTLIPKSTLPNRYARLMPDVMLWDDNLLSTLVSADINIDNEIEVNATAARNARWTTVANKLLEAGGPKLSAVHVEKKFNALTKEEKERYLKAPVANGEEDVEVENDGEPETLVVETDEAKTDEDADDGGVEV